MRRRLEQVEERLGLPSHPLSSEGRREVLHDVVGEEERRRCDEMSGNYDLKDHIFGMVDGATFAIVHLARVNSKSDAAIVPEIEAGFCMWGPPSFLRHDRAFCSQACNGIYTRYRVRSKPSRAATPHSNWGIESMWRPVKDFLRKELNHYINSTTTAAANWEQLLPRIKMDWNTKLLHSRGFSPLGAIIGMKRTTCLDLGLGGVPLDQQGGLPRDPEQRMLLNDVLDRAETREELMQGYQNHYESDFEKRQRKAGSKFGVCVERAKVGDMLFRLTGGSNKMLAPTVNNLYFINEVLSVNSVRLTSVDLAPVNFSNPVSLQNCIKTGANVFEFDEPIDVKVRIRKKDAVAIKLDLDDEGWYKARLYNRLTKWFVLEQKNLVIHPRMVTKVSAGQVTHPFYSQEEDYCGGWIGWGVMSDLQQHYIITA